MSRHYQQGSPMYLELQKLPYGADEVLDTILDWNDTRDFDLTMYLRGGDGERRRHAALVVLLVDLLQQAVEDRESWSDTATELQDKLDERDNDALDRSLYDGD